MVLWPGLGRREVRLHTSEETSACSCLTCATRCILLSALHALHSFVFVLFSAFWFMAPICDLFDLLACCWISRWWSEGIALFCWMPVTYHACNSRQIYFIYQLCAGAAGIAEIRFEQPVRLLRDYRGFHYSGSRNYFSRVYILVGFNPLRGCRNVFRS